MLKYVINEKYLNERRSSLVRKNEEEKKITIKKFFEVMLPTVAGLLLVGGLTDMNTFKRDTEVNMAGINATLTGITSNLEKLDNKIEKLGEEITNLKTDIGSLKIDMAVVQAMQDSNGINGVVNTSTSYRVVNSNETFREITNLNRRSMDINTTSLIFSEDTIIGTDEAGNDLSLGELEDIPFYTNYYENGHNIWFYGQVDENGRWDGLCILNNYKDGKLVSLLEATYVNGVRMGEYRTVRYEENGVFPDTFLLNDREYKGEFNIGKTHRYRTIKWSESSSFKSDRPVRYEDCLPGQLILYYSGQTSDELFNDNTGDAFYISYTPNNEVRLIYQGHFVGGRFSDNRESSGNVINTENSAFWVILAEDESQYLYYEGAFVNGNPKNRNWYDAVDARIALDANPSDRLPNQNNYPELIWKSW